ncbi:L,D-transpeptidase [Streptomyces sp. B1866]|uniref:L,D-transpeptidase n=1 Tax=Streptomyces sp. B1866 TaxID=3075431 RepID=UPI00288DD17A|nr:L,D-transpeptidase [Streptomyces sp. B1866]MDT3396604.1 L,D-transpeptidase [Streptomyces sp. B1866]
MVLSSVVAMTGAAVPVALGSPAAAATTATAPTATSAQAASGRSYTYLEFKKGSNPLNSRLRFIYVQVINPDKVRTWVIDSWRAGSGNGSKDTCATGRGWLPNGTYKIRQYYPHHNGGPRGVNGIAWDIGNHKCHSGKWRTELFIHSKMRPDGRQGTGPYRWTGSYASNGCIKLSPHDIRELQDLRSNYPHPSKLYVS